LLNDFGSSVDATCFIQMILVMTREFKDNTWIKDGVRYVTAHDRFLDLDLEAVRASSLACNHTPVGQILRYVLRLCCTCIVAVLQLCCGNVAAMLRQCGCTSCPLPRRLPLSLCPQLPAVACRCVLWLLHLAPRLPLLYFHACLPVLLSPSVPYFHGLRFEVWPVSNGCC